MTLLYKITPRFKNNIYVKYTCYGKTSLNNIKEFVIKDHYETGYAYRYSLPTRTELLYGNIKCDPSMGNKLIRNTHTDFYFDDGNFNDIEMNYIKSNYQSLRYEWLRDNPLWSIEEDLIQIKDEVKIELVNENGIIKEIVYDY